MANLLASRAQIERLLQKHPQLNYDVAAMIAENVESSRNADIAKVRKLVNRHKTRRAKQHRERTVLAHQTRRQHQDPNNTLAEFADFVNTMNSIDKIYGPAPAPPPPGVNPFGASGIKARKTRGKKRGKKTRGRKNRK